MPWGPRGTRATVPLRDAVAAVEAAMGAPSDAYAALGPVAPAPRPALSTDPLC